MGISWSNRESTGSSWPAGRSRWSASGNNYDVNDQYTRALDEARRRDGRPPLAEEKRRKQRIASMLGAAVGAGLIAAGAGFFWRRRSRASTGSRLRSYLPWSTRARFSARAKLIPFRAKTRARAFTGGSKAMRNVVKRIA